MSPMEPLVWPSKRLISAAEAMRLLGAPPSEYQGLLTWRTSQSARISLDSAYALLFLQCWMRREGRARFAAARDPELREDAVQVRSDRPVGEIEPLADLSVREPLGGLWWRWPGHTCWPSSALEGARDRRLATKRH
jgi:hypothetical protein